MANSISLSTDMKTLYFTDSGGFATTFSLAGNGVYITSILNDVHVISAPGPLGIGDDDFEVGVTAQWDACYHPNTNQALMIGSEDIEQGIAEVKSYSLDKGKVINLRLNDIQTKLLIRT